MKQNSSQSKDRQTESCPQLSKSGLVFILALVTILFLVVLNTAEVTPIIPAPKAKRSMAKKLSEPRPLTAEQVPVITEVPPEDPLHKVDLTPLPKLVPKSMELTKKILVSKKWNDGDDSFGLNKPPEGEEGDSIAPASILRVKDATYVLDNVHNRILGYDKEGKLISTANLPSGGLAVDLVPDPTDSSLFVIDQYQDKIHKVKGNEVTTIDSVPLRESLVVGARFGYDAETKTLWAQDMENGGEVAVMRNGEVVQPDQREQGMFATARAASQDQSILVTLKSGAMLNVQFDKRVACVEQADMDAKGIVWVMFTLDGDYRIRRLARVDPVQKTAGVAELDIWFAYDGIRHMTSTGNGTVFFVGDPQEGKVISYDYAGGAL